jgi:malate dehydrogenase
MAESYLKDKRRLLPCAALCEGEFGIQGLFLGVPALIGAKGIERIFEIKLTPEENALLQKTVASVTKTVQECKI